MTSPLRHLFALVLGLFALGTVAFAAPVRFDIPAQPAPTALKAFIQQSGVQVVFNADDLKDVQANEVKGEFEPPAALAALIKGTGFTASQRSGGLYVIVREKGEAAVGAVKGSLLGADGRGLSGALVVLRETSQSTSTDRYGNYLFDSVPAGTYLLVATMDGYQPLHITDIVVRGGRELTLAKESMRKAVGDLVSLDPYVVRAEQVTELDRYEVVGSRMKPFVDGNVDIPRTIDDVQPYYVLDSKTIAQSGALNTEDFLKNMLSMNTTSLQNSQLSGLDRAGSVNIYGGLSSINLRGIGSDKTLILINGRRTSGISFGGSAFQPDVNGLPLSAIERVEVLPTSASGIYGGGAIGGVINFVLKRNFRGGEVKLSYDNTQSSDAPTRTLSVVGGMSLENGKTQIMVSGQISDSNPLQVQDRKEIYQESFNTIRKNSPNFFFNNISPILGATPNIASRLPPFVTIDGLRTGQNLILKDGRSLNSPITFIPAGTSPSVSPQALGSALIANAGSFNFDLPASYQQPRGALSSLGIDQTIRSLQANIRRQMGSRLELFAEFGVYENSSRSVFSPIADLFIISAANPTNPFNQNVAVRPPSGVASPLNTKVTSQTVSVGAIANLPRDWTAELDVTRSIASFRSEFKDADLEALSTAIDSGQLNLFVDTIANDPGFAKYLYDRKYNNKTQLDDYALRAAGPIDILPWGAARVSTAVERRIETLPEVSYIQDFPISVSNSYIVKNYNRKQVTDSVYAEAQIPLVKPHRWPLLEELEAQISGRSEKFAVSSGTRASRTFFKRNPVVTVYDGPTKNGVPFQDRTTYASNNTTFGLKYKPTKDLSVRVSYSTAFLPPSPTDLVRNPALNPFTSSVLDPKTGTSYSVQTLSGGNPDLKPQNSKSWNIGLIAEPFKGFRANVEYYAIYQYDAIGSLSLQTIVNNEGLYSSRVHRNVGGQIVDVDTSLLNLYKRDTRGVDVTVSYAVETLVGTFSSRFMGTKILSLRNQYDVSLPELEYVTFVNEGGAAKYKANASFGWERKQWRIGWNTRYFGRYKQYGVAGGPEAMQFNNGAATATTTFLVPQGGDSIPSQTYHDLTLGWSADSDTSVAQFAQKHGLFGLMRGVGIEIGVKNVFNKAPPIDVYQNTYFYRSPYGDLRLRSYWISLKKAF